MECHRTYLTSFDEVVTPTLMLEAPLSRTMTGARLMMWSCLELHGSYAGSLTVLTPDRRPGSCPSHVAGGKARFAILKICSVLVAVSIGYNDFMYVLSGVYVLCAYH